MNFSELKAELAARGFNHITDDRRGQFINDARRQLDNMFMWPYRENYESGTAPLAISDLGRIEAVVDVTNHRPLAFRSFRDLLEEYGDLERSGTPDFFYVAWPSGTPVVAVYPTTTATIGVQYYRRTPMLSSPGDSPLAPVEFHSIIVDIAAQFAYRSKDEFAAAAGLQMNIDQAIVGMADELLGEQQIVNAQSQVVVREAADA